MHACGIMKRNAVIIEIMATYHLYHKASYHHHCHLHLMVYSYRSAEGNK